MVKVYNIENSIVMEDEKNNSTVQFYFDFEPLVMFNKDFDYTYKEEMESRRKAIVIEIDSEEDNDLYTLLSSLLKQGSSLNFVDDSPMGQYIEIKKPNILNVSNKKGKIKIRLKADRSEASTSVFLNPNLVNLDLFYKLIDALARHLNILDSAENRKLMYTNYNRMLRDYNEN